MSDDLSVWRSCNEQLLSDQSPFSVSTDEAGCRRFSNAPATLLEAIQSGRQHDKLPFVVWQQQRLSFADFFAAADQLTAALQQVLLIRPGERVAIAMRNRPEWMIAFVACVQAGAVPVPLNSWGLRDELLHAIEDAGASLVICDPARLRQLNGCLADTPVVLVDGDSDPAQRQFGWQALLDRELAPMQLATPAASDPALLLYTSGTTSHAKGVISSHDAVAQTLFSLDYQGAFAAMTSPQRIQPIMASGLQPTALLCFPLFHVSGLHSQFLAALRHGRRIVIMYKWDVDEALRLIETDQCTQFNGSPSMVQQLLAHPRFASEATRSLFAIGIGGGASSRDLLDRLLTLKPSAMSGTGYGMTENNGICAAHSGEQFVQYPQSVGWPLPIVDVVIGEAPDRPQAAGGSGPIWMRSPTVMSGYRNLPGESVETLRNGWLFTGDVGHLDDDGMLHITDRIKDIIIRGGENISALEVEQCAATHAAVIEAAAFALPDAILGETVALVACIRSELSEDALRQHIAARLAGYKVPARVLLTREPLQRNATGKLQKPLIRQALGL